MKSTIAIIYFVLLSNLLLVQHSTAARIIYENNLQQAIPEDWQILNPDWSSTSQGWRGAKHNGNWAILQSPIQLPENYEITFSSQLEAGSVLVEVMLNLAVDEHSAGQMYRYLGVLYGALNKTLQFEDRSLYAPAYMGEEHYSAQTEDNIGRLPQAHIEISTNWVDWRILKLGSDIYIWLNQEEIAHYSDRLNVVPNKGRLGFVVNGSVYLKNLKVRALDPEEIKKPEYFNNKASLWNRGYILFQ